jgi:hypothetical protein
MATVRVLDKVLETANLSEGSLSYNITNKEHIKNVIDAYLVKWGFDRKYSVVPSIDNATDVW